MLIAKRGENGAYQTLEGHTIDSLKVFFQYIEKNQKVMEYFCLKWSLDIGNFIKNMYTIIYLHDCGKAIDEFQQRILKNQHSPDYPHAYHSIYIITQLILNKINVFLSLSKSPYIELCTIMAHHSQLHRGIYENMDKISHNYNDFELNNFINEIASVYYKLGFHKYAGDYNINSINVAYGMTNKDSVEKVRKFIRDNVFGVKDDLRKKCRDKAIFTYMLSILKTSDILSSRYFDDYSGNSENQQFDGVLDKDVLQTIKVLRVEEIFNGNKPYEYQRELLNLSADAILVAGCGRGKTEASQIIANNIINKNMANKIIYAMPTQVTGNAMAERMARIYGWDNVGIYHGKSLINKMMDYEGEDIDYKEIKDENYESKNFIKPIGITTVDHILYCLIHAYNSADYTCGNLQNSIIIFDEIHYYEKNTTEYIFEALRILREMKIHHILMSATLPEYIIRDIKDKYTYVEDSAGFKYTPFIMKKVDEYLIQKIDGEYLIYKDFIERLSSNYNKGIRQTIIVNTVEKAQNIYQEIIDKICIDKDNIILFHGRFTVDDRKAKERQIFKTSKNHPFILVTTQIIEVSIDVSCSVMFTELAPFDALAQRGGRLNRKGKEYLIDGIEQIMYVYNTDSPRPYAKDEEDEKYHVLRDSWGLISDKPINYEIVKNKVNTIYSKEKLMLTDYTNKWFVESVLFGNTPEDVRGTKVDEDTGGHFSTRSCDFKQIDVVPSCKIQDCMNYINAARNTVKIPQYLYFQEIDAFYTHVIEKVEYKVCKYKYSYEKGIEVGVYDNTGYFN